MSAEQIVSLVSTLGFPIVACFGLGLYIYWNEKKSTEREEKREEKLYEEIRYNREVNKELLETNKLLARDIKSELTDIKTIIQKGEYIYE